MDTPGPAALVAEDLSRSFGAVRALADVTMAAGPGEIVGVIGPNGAGKTTLLSCLLGFLRPDAGRIVFEGRPPDDLAVRAVTGWAPDRLPVAGFRTGLAMLRLHHALARRPPDGRERDVRAVLDEVRLDPAATTRPPRTWSTGMRQRLAVAQSLLGRPRLLLLDEPVAGVDPAGVVAIRGALRRRADAGATVVLSSHHLDEVERACDRVLFLADGRLVDAASALPTARRLILRFAAAAPGAAPLAARTGARVLGAAADRLVVEVSSEDAAAALVRALVEAGVAVAEARAETRLESLFTPGSP